MNIIDKVKSFEDACKVLGIQPALPVVDGCHEKDKKSIIAFSKLSIIIRALNEGWEPDWTDWSQRKYFVYPYVGIAGLAYASTSFTVSNTRANFGSRLGFKTDALCDYAKGAFWDLFVDYFFLPGNERG